MIRVLQTEAELAALEPDWAALWRRTPGATPFQSPAWLLPWWRQFGTDAPLVGTAWQDGVLTGVLPMYVLHEPGCRKLLPIGAGTTDYLDALGGPAAPLLDAVLARARPHVDRCDLIELPPGSALHGAPSPPGWRATWSDGEPCPVLTLPAIPPGIRRKLRMSRHRAERGGGWTTEIATAATIGPLQDELIRLHQARWTAQGAPGVLASPLVTAFHREAAPRLLRDNAVRLQVLRIGGAVAAAILALLAEERILFYLSGFDAAHGFVSPGTILLGDMLEAAIAEGRTEAHFLRGREAYKYAWGGVDRFNRTCSLVPA